MAKKTSSLSMVRGAIAAVVSAVMAIALAAVAFCASMPSATKGQPWVNSLGMKFVPVPETDVLFCIWETRVRDFEAFVSATGYDATQGAYTLGADGWKQRGGSWKSPGFAQTGMHPVCCVSWEDAKAFCKWLTEKERGEGRLRGGQEYRLPMTAEWSVAVGFDNRSMDRTKVYPWGSQWPPPAGAGNYPSEELRNAERLGQHFVIEGYRDGYAQTSPVGSFSANPYDLYDLGGNVREYCEGWAKAETRHRTTRGGSWYSLRGFEELRSHYVVGWLTNHRHATCGFRCVLSAESASTNGKAPAVQAQPIQNPKVSDEEARRAAQLVASYRNGLVFFEGKDGQGSGFIADYKGQKFLFSNAHVIAGIKGAIFKLLDRTPVNVGGGSVAVGHDTLALSVISGGTPIPMAGSVEKEAAIGDPVVVLGNAEGGGVINTLTGNIVGIGPDRVEVDAPFQLGNSGSPIIHLPTGKVIGIATYITTKRRFGEQQVTVRRFGYRLDSVQQWQPIDWNRFYAEADTMKRIERTTSELIELHNELAMTRQVFGNYETTAIRYALDSFKRSRDSRNDVKPLISALSSICLADVREAGAKLTYDYFRRDLADQKRVRDDLVNHFSKLSK